MDPLGTGLVKDPLGSTEHTWEPMLHSNAPIRLYVINHRPQSKILYEF